MSHVSFGEEKKFDFFSIFILSSYTNVKEIDFDASGDKNLEVGLLRYYNANTKKVRSVNMNIAWNIINIIKDHAEIDNDKELETLINEQANFELDDLDQKVIFAMAEYFYDNPKAKNDLLKYANSNENFNIKMSLKDLNTFINNWDEELHGKFL